MDEIRNVLQTQHGEVAMDIRALRGQLHPILVEVEAEEIWQAMDLFLRKLDVHLTLEDALLYGRVNDPLRPEQRQSLEAIHCLDDGLRERLQRFRGDWREAGQLEGEAEAFTREARELLNALEARIEREDNELFPALFDPPAGGQS